MTVEQEEIDDEVEQVLREDGEYSIDEEPNMCDPKIDERYSYDPSDGNDTAGEGNSFSSRLKTEGKDLREQPKLIVFLSHLMMLFKFCHLCQSPDPSVSTSQTGTMITVTTKCQKCENIYTWSSQPMLLGRFPAFNLLLSFGILCAGASVKKVLLVLRHINVLIYNESTYYYHQKHLLIPSIIYHWRKYQTKLLDQVDGQEVALAGDGRHDSMGHSAKYCTYTIFCCTIGLIMNITQVQR
ncbi:uncharacterized protein LOC110238694 [Exaiptasia diaphana]|uniref:Uncharacterized protein n=1 Tax=Exaiptasia diaphana TaxID=2652724 RepID=A0A913YI38_EXADI|nr:uncharacterized protein LOC110238694 [Exaiptasia diaphana]